MQHSYSPSLDALGGRQGHTQTAELTTIPLRAGIPEQPPSTVIISSFRFETEAQGNQGPFLMSQRM